MRASRLKSLNRASEEGMSEIDGLRHEIERLASQHADKAEIILELQDKIDRLKAEISNLNLRHMEMTAEIERLQNERADMALQIERLKADNEWWWKTRA